MSSDVELRAQIRVMQIIAAALPMGVIPFLGVVVFLILSGQLPANPNPNLPIVSILAVFMLASVSIAAFIVPPVLIKAGLGNIARGTADAQGQGDVKQLAGLYQTALIVRMALFEGAAFMGCVALLSEKQLWVSAVPVVALAVMFLNFPTENSVRNWLEMQARRVLELRES